MSVESAVGPEVNSCRSLWERLVYVLKRLSKACQMAFRADSAPSSSSTSNLSLTIILASPVVFASSNLIHWAESSVSWSPSFLMVRFHVT